MAGRNVSFAMRAGAVFASVALVFGLVPTQALAESAIELNGESTGYSYDDGGITVQDYESIAVESTNEIVVENTTTYDTSDSLTVESPDGIVVQGGSGYDGSAAGVSGGYADLDGSGLLVAQADLPKYTVTFDANGGVSNPDSQQVEEGKKATTPIMPQRPGWDFAGWYRTPTPTAADTPVDFLNETITGDETFYAGWKAQLTVKVYDRTGKQFGVGGKASLDGGSAASELKEDVFDGATVQLGAQADSNYRLVGWSTDGSDPAAHIATSSADYSLTFDGKAATVVAVFGELVTIDFDVNGGTLGKEWEDSKQVDYGSSIAYGTVPTAIDPDYATAPKGSKFAGLEFDVAGTVYRYECGQTIPPLSITGPTTVTYLWEMDLATVTFVDDDGTTLLPATQYPVGTAAADIARPNDPTKAATAEYTFTFIGWTPKVSDVTGDVTYTADYSRSTRTYQIRFVNDNGVLLQSGQVAYGETPQYLGMTPVKSPSATSVYTFSGWSPAITSVTGDATYTATFSESPRPVKLTFQLNGGELDGETSKYVADVAVGDSYRLPEPTRDGFEFQYWWTGEKHYPDEAWNVSGNQLFLAIWRAAGGGSGGDGDSGDSGSTTTVDYVSDGSGTTTTSTIASTGDGTTRTTTTVTPSGSTTGTTTSTVRSTTGTTSKVGSSTTTKSTIGSSTKTTLSKTADPQAEQLVIEMLFAVSGVLLIAGGYELTRRRSLR